MCVGVCVFSSSPFLSMTLWLYDPGAAVFLMQYFLDLNRLALDIDPHFNLFCQLVVQCWSDTPWDLLVPCHILHCVLGVVQRHPAL